MVFSSIPAAYLDPANWQQQPNLQPIGSSQGSTQLLQSTPLPPPPPPAPPLHTHGVGGTGSIRPGSMAERARLANISMPDAALKCPRCDSTNTKFCYFNNYSLTQPRHFCKTCRRYWTRGGALRNVPVGGGCRRNKRNKGTSSKSPVTGDRQALCSSSSSTLGSHSSSSDILGLGSQVSPLRFLSPLHHLAEFSTPTQDHVGLNYSSVLSNQVGGVSDHFNFQIGSALASAGLGSAGILGGTGGSGAGSLLSLSGLDQWRIQQGQQFPYFVGFDSSNASNPSGGVYPMETGVDPSPYGGESSMFVRPKMSISGPSQLASVKMEETQELNLSRQFSGVNPNINDQYWSGIDLTCFSSSSTTNPI